jgi:hypothetical protein
MVPTIRCGDAKIIGQNAEIRGDGKRNLRGFADVMGLTTIDAG